MAMAHYLFMAMVAATVCIHFTLANTETAETESLRTLLSGLRATLRILVRENWQWYCMELAASIELMRVN